MSDREDITRKLRGMIGPEQPETAEFLGRGPYELPKCSKAEAQPLNDDYFLLQLQTEDHSQQLLVPVATHALRALCLLANHLLKQLDAKKH